MPESFAAAAGTGAGADSAAFAAQAEAMKAASEAAYEDAAAREADRAATDQSTASAMDSVKAQYMLAMAERMRASSAREAAGAEFDQSAATLASIDATLTLAKTSGLYDEAMKAVNGELQETAPALDAVTRATDSASLAAGRGYGAWRLLTKEFALWGGVFGNASMIGKVAGWHVALDGLFESAVALGEGLAALSVGIAAMVPAGKDIAVHLKAVSDVSTALGVSIAPLSGKFQALGQAMAPQTVEAYGGALDLVNRNGTTLATVAGEVVTGIDDWIAKLDLWRQSQGSTGQILQDGVGFLHQFEQAVDNVAIAVDHLMRADPGTAHFLMDLVVGATKVLDVITELPAPVLRTALALHSFTLWGGLLATQALKLAGPLRSLSLAMGGVAAEETALTAAGKDATGWTALKATLTDIGTGFLTWGRGIGTAVREAEGLGKVGAGLGAAFSFVNPVAVGLAALAAGAGYLTYEMLQSSAASKQFAQNANQAFTQSSATQFLTQFPQLAAQGIQGLNQAVHEGTRAWVPYNDAMSATGDDLKKLVGFNSGLNDVAKATMNILPDAAKTVVDFFTGAVHAQQAANSVSNYTGALANLNKGQAQLLGTMDGLISKGHSVADSLALMDLAGVKASDGAALAAKKVQNLITGYRNLSVGGNALMNSVDAVTFASEQQSSKVATLTQAWSTFISTVTGGESAFTGFAQQVQGVTTAATTSANQLSVSNGKASDTTKAAGAAAASAQVSIQGLSSASLQLRSSFIQAITQGSTLYNSLETMASAAGLGKQGISLLSQAGRDMVAELLPMTQHSKAAVAMLYALAEQAGYRGADSFKALAEWVGKVRHPMKDLDSITTQLTVDSADLATDVKNLANAIGESLNQAMAQALLQAGGGQKAFDQFADAMSNSHETASGLRTAAANLATKLLEVLGNTQAAHKEFDTFAIAMHMSKAKADELWTSIESGSAQAAAAARANAAAITTAIDNIPSQKTINIIERAVNVAGGGGGPSGAGNPFTRGMASGGKVPGYGGGDRWPAWLEGGEAVVPKELVPAVAPFLGAHHVPGFAAGGIVHGGSGGSPWDMGEVAALWAREIWKLDKERYGRNSPIALREMQAIMSGEIPGHGLPRTGLGRLLGLDEHRDITPYARKDLEYWKVLGERHKLSESEKRAIERLHKEIAKARLDDSLKEAHRLQVRDSAMEKEYWKLTREITAYEKIGDTRAAARLLRERAVLSAAETKLYDQIKMIEANYALVHGDRIGALRAADAAKFRGYSRTLELLELEMGYGGPVLPGAVYDKGGYLPVGLSVAYNGTGKPEPVGTQPDVHVHVHMHGDLADETLWDRLQAQTLDYGYQNTGRPTGVWQPGG